MEQTLYTCGTCWSLSDWQSTSASLANCGNGNTEVNLIILYPSVNVCVCECVPLNKNWSGSLQCLFPQQLQSCQPFLCLSYRIDCKMRRQQFSLLTFVGPCVARNYSTTDKVNPLKLKLRWNHSVWFQFKRVKNKHKKSLHQIYHNTDYIVYRLKVKKCSVISPPRLSVLRTNCEP